MGVESILRAIPIIGSRLAPAKEETGAELGFVVPARANLEGGGQRAGAEGSVAIFHDERWVDDPLVETTLARVGVEDAGIGVELTGFAVMDGADASSYERVGIKVTGRIFSFRGSASSGEAPKAKPKKT